MATKKDCRYVGVRSHNPHRLKVYGTPVNRKYVEKYKKNPNAGDMPHVYVLANGEAWVEDGKHHTLAAREAGRNLRARTYEEVRKPGGGGSESGCALVLIAFGGGLAAFAAAAATAVQGWPT